MANKHHKPEEIVAKLRQVDVLVGQGMDRIDATRYDRCSHTFMSAIGIAATVTFWLWVLSLDNG